MHSAIVENMNLCRGVPLAVSKEGARKGRMGGRSKAGSERQHTKEAEACKTNERTGATETHRNTNGRTMAAIRINYNVEHCCEHA